MREGTPHPDHQNLLKDNLQALSDFLHDKRRPSRFSDLPKDFLDGAREMIRTLKEWKIDVSDQEKELLSLEAQLIEKGLLQKINIEKHVNKQETLIENTGRPTREEIAKKAKEFVERHKNMGYHGDIHNQIVEWSWGERPEEAQHYYPGWTKEDFHLYAHEIKKLEPESEWGTALYEIPM